jgi:hypothetical protein
MLQELSFEQMPASMVELHRKIDGLDEKLSEWVASKMAQDERLLSASEACKLFIPAISRLTLIRWTKADYLKEHRIGGRVYYKQSEVIDAAKHLQKYKSKVELEKSVNDKKKIGVTKSIKSSTK